MKKLFTIFTFFIFMQSAYAFKLDTHLWVGQQVLNDINSNLEPNNVSYVTISPFGKFRVDSDIVNAITSSPKSFLYGTIGPDGFPDVFSGQLSTHPGDGGNAGGGIWGTDQWMSHMLSGRKDLKPAELAFSLGYLSHGASDFWAHTYVNTYSGNVFSLTDGETINEKRHFVLEGYINSHTPGSSVGAQNNLKSFQLLNAYSDQLPKDFIKNRLILNDDVKDQYNKIDTKLLHLIMMQELPGLVGDLKSFVNTFRDARLVILEQVFDAITPTWENINGSLEEINEAVCTSQLELSVPGVSIAADFSSSLGELSNTVNNRAYAEIDQAMVKVTNATKDLTNKQFDLVSDIHNALSSATNTFLSVNQDILSAQAELITKNNELEAKIIQIASQSSTLASISCPKVIWVIDGQTCNLLGCYPKGHWVQDPVCVAGYNATLSTLQRLQAEKANLESSMLGLQQRIQDLQTRLFGELNDSINGLINELRDIVINSVDLSYGLHASQIRRVNDLLINATSNTTDAFQNVLAEVNDGLTQFCGNLREVEQNGNALLVEGAPFYATYLLSSYLDDNDSGDDFWNIPTSIEDLTNTGVGSAQYIEYVYLYLKLYEKSLEKSADLYVDLAKNVVDASLKKEDVSSLYSDYIDCGVPLLIGVPPAATAAACTVTSDITEIVIDIKRLVDRVNTVVEDISADLDPTGVVRQIVDKKRKIDEKINSVSKFFTDPDFYLSQLGDDGLVGFIKLVRSGEESKIELNSLFNTSGLRDDNVTSTNFLYFDQATDPVSNRIDADMGLTVSGVFNPDVFSPAYNAVVLSKLSLLSASELNRVIQVALTQQGVDNIAPLFTQPLQGEFNILINGVKTIDGSHQWLSKTPPYPRVSPIDFEQMPDNHSYGPGDGGFVLYQNPTAREYVFKQIFKGPAVVGVEVPSINEFPTVLSEYYPYRVCVDNVFPDGIDDMSCSPLGIEDKLLRIMINLQLGREPDAFITNAELLSITSLDLRSSSIVEYLNSAKSQRAELESQYDLLSIQLSDAILRLSVVESEITAPLLELNAAKSQLAKTLSELSLAQNNLTSLMAPLINLKTQLDVKNAELEALTIEYFRAKSFDVCVESTKGPTCKEQFAQNSLLMKELQNQMAIISTVITLLQADIAALEKVILPQRDLLLAEIMSLENTITGLTADVAIFTLQVNPLQIKKSEIQNEIDIFLITMASVAENIVKLTENIHAFDNLSDNVTVKTLSGLQYASNLTLIKIDAGLDYSSLISLPELIILIDSDGDDIADANDNCPAVKNSDQSNIDGDALGDVCDADADGDGYTVLLGDINDMDSSVHPIRGDINFDGQLTVADILLLESQLLNKVNLSPKQYFQCDLYPVNAPDNNITVSDLYLLQKIVLKN